MHEAMKRREYFKDMGTSEELDDQKNPAAEKLCPEFVIIPLLASP